MPVYSASPSLSSQSPLAREGSSEETLPVLTEEQSICYGTLLSRARRRTQSDCERTPFEEHPEASLHRVQLIVGSIFDRYTKQWLDAVKHLMSEKLTSGLPGLGERSLHHGQRLPSQLIAVLATCTVSGNLPS